MWQSKVKTLLESDFPNGIASSNFDETLQDFMNEQGREGWEPYSIVEASSSADPQSWYISIYLKRWVIEDE